MYKKDHIVRIAFCPLFSEGFYKHSKIEKNMSNNNKK